MAEGSLTRHFGMPLVNLLAKMMKTSLPDFNTALFMNAVKEIDKLPLMGRIHLIADSLSQVLPDEAESAWRLQESVIGPPLTANQQTFNDGYWMLPLADYWARHQILAFDTAIVAIGELTRRGTSEFGVRSFFQMYPERMKGVLKQWAINPCFHVRRLASEGSRLYLPWGGRLKVSEKDSEDYLRIITALKTDPSSYVRRSVGNHVRDWRRINPEIADKWVAENNPPKDVLRLALPKRR